MERYFAARPPSRTAIRPGMLDQVTTALGDLVAFIEVHVDSASLEFHLDVAGPAFRPFVGLVTLSSIDIFGAPSERPLDQLRKKLRLLGAGDVCVHAPVAGFFRADDNPE